MILSSLPVSGGSPLWQPVTVSVSDPDCIASHFSVSQAPSPEAQDLARRPDNCRENLPTVTLEATVTWHEKSLLFETSGRPGGLGARESRGSLTTVKQARDDRRKFRAAAQNLKCTVQRPVNTQFNESRSVRTVSRSATTKFTPGAPRPFKFQGMTVMMTSLNQTTLMTSPQPVY
eukprot:g30274.t1